MTDHTRYSPTHAGISTALEEKYITLQNIMREYGNIVVAFSGGVDSSFLLKVAHDVLGDGALGVTARSATFPEREYNEAVEFAHKWQINHRTIVSEELDVEGFADNPKNRCFLCKSELFTKITAIAAAEGYKVVAEGSNADDLLDYRPGLQAVKDQGVVSPLRQADLNKQEIRDLSRMLGLSTWDKPAFACLSSRFPYGEQITREKLQAIDQAEQYLMDIGFRQVRVRHHGTIARIEVESSNIEKITGEPIRIDIDSHFRKLGFAYVCVDLKGYRTGSMNETIDTTISSGENGRA